MQDLKQWGLFKLKNADQGHKAGKIPVNALTGKYASSTDPNTWTDFNTALSKLGKYNSKGLAFFFANGYIGLDLDELTQPKQSVSNNNRDVQTVMNKAKKPYIERSQSGTGIHAIFKGKLPAGAKNKQSKSEIYEQDRFFALTGDVINAPSELPTLNDLDMARLYDTFFTREEVTTVKANRPGVVGNNKSLSEIMRMAKNDSTFQKLMSGDIRDYNSDESVADFALAVKCLYYTDHDIDKAREIMESSNLVRDKWYKKHGKDTYLNLTLTKADAKQDQGVSDKKPKYSVELKNNVERALNKPKYDINEGLKPFDIYTTKLPDSIDFFKYERIPEELVDEIKAEVAKFNAEKFKPVIPSWLDAHWGVTKSNHVYLFVDIEYHILAKAFLKNNPMLSFDGLPEGSRYSPKNGTWKIIKGKAFTMVKKVIDKIIDRWGIQDLGLEHQATDKVTSLMYSDSIQGNPFDDRNPALASFKNGVFNMETGKIQPKDPKYYLTAQHDYDLEISNDPTPETERYVKAILGDAYNLFCEFIGHGFYGYYVFNKALFIHGKGGNGKSELLNWLRTDVFGNENTAQVAPQDYSGGGSQFVPADLYGMDVDIVNELKKGMIYNTEAFKSQLGNDRIVGQLKGGQRFNFIGHATTFIASNFYPQYNDSSEGMADRIVIVEAISPNFRRNPKRWEKLNIDFKKIKAERGRFVYQCIKKFMLAMKNGCFTIPESVEQSTNKFLQGNDILNQWLEEYTDISFLGQDRGELTETAFDRFHDFEQKILGTNVKDKLTNLADFRNQLSDKGYKVGKSTKSWDREDHRRLSRVIGLKFVATSYLIDIKQNVRTGVQ